MKKMLCFIVVVAYIRIAAAASADSVIYIPFRKLDAGAIYSSQYDYYKFAFPYKNISNYPICVVEAHGSSGSTVPLYNKKPVMPGQWDTVYCSYSIYSSHGPFSKSLTVRWDSIDNSVVFIMRGEVVRYPVKLSIYDSLQQAYLQRSGEESPYHVNKFMKTNCFTITNNDTVAHYLSLDSSRHTEAFYDNGYYVETVTYESYFHKGKKRAYACYLQPQESIDLHFFRNKDYIHSIPLTLDKKYYIGLDIGYR